MVEFKNKETVALAAQQLITDPANADDVWLSQSLRNAGAAAVKRAFDAWQGADRQRVFREVGRGYACRMVYPRTFEEKRNIRCRIIARTGKRSIEISAEKAAELWRPYRFPVDRNAEYELSAWIKTENVAGGGRGAQLYISGHPGSPAKL